MTASVLQIGEFFRGLDCHNELVSGTVSTILQNTFIIENGTEHFVIKKSEIEKQGEYFPKQKNKEHFNAHL